MERNFILDLVFTSEIIFKYKLCIINQDTPVKLEQCELSQKREFDHTCSGRIDMSHYKDKPVPIISGGRYSFLTFKRDQFLFLAM